MKPHLARLLAGETLDEASAARAMGAIMDGDATPAQVGALLAAMAARGETEDEIVGFARAMRDRAVRIRSDWAVDTCGTGGDGAGTFNVSTVASLVVAACGVPVAKHGNRSSSGGCGSADVLEFLGVAIDASPGVVQRCLDEVGWAFLFAPAFHASTRHAVGPRRELGAPTAFNLLGPLTNPARPVAQLVGVPRPERTAFLARCLARLGTKRAWVVHGDGLDELSPCGVSRVAALQDGVVTEFEVTPESAGLERCGPDALAGGSVEACAAAAWAVLDGEKGPRRDAVVLNAAAALIVADRARDLSDAAALAGRVLDEGKAAQLLERVRAVSRS